MRKYEFLLVLSSKLDDSKRTKFLEDFEKRIDGNIVEKTEWGLKKLAYPIKKEQEGYYILYYIEADSENVIKTKQWLYIKKELLRPMILVHEKKWPFEQKTSKDIVFPKREPRNAK